MDLIYGRNPVLETLRARRREFFGLSIQEALDPSEIIEEIQEHANQLKIMVEIVPRREMDQRVKNHQGVLLQAGPYPMVEVSSMLAFARERAEPAFLMLLDQLQDPQNFGTLLRTSEAVGVHGVLLPIRHTVSVTPAVVNASSGASEHLNITQVNLAKAMRLLKQSDIWMVGLEHSDQAQRLDQVDLEGPVGLVVGSEGGGLRPLVRKHCDFLVKIPMRGRIASLNAAVAGSLALYRIWEQRQAKP